MEVRKVTSKQVRKLWGKVAFTYACIESRLADASDILVVVTDVSTKVHWSYKLAPFVESISC